jgi:hypothetical protein
LPRSLPLITSTWSSVLIRAGISVLSVKARVESRARTEHGQDAGATV